MPKAQEEKLHSIAQGLARKGKLRTSGKYKTLEQAENAFVYGTMRHQSGWKPGKRKSKY